MIDVSIIVPFYKNVEWLYQSINSIDEQNISYEIILINDGSMEEIDLKKIDKTDKIKFINNKNQGAGKSRNEGISFAKGEYISFLDSDDLYCKDKLYKQINYMKKNDYKWSHTSYIKFFSNGTQKKVNNEEFINKVFPICLAYNPIATPTVVIKKSVFENRKIRFAEDVNFGEDGYLWYEIAKEFPLGHLDEYLTYVRITDTNANRKVFSHIQFRNKIYSELKKESFVFSKYKIPFDLKIAYIITSIINNMKLKEGIVMKGLYLVPYLIFKRHKTIQKGRFRNQ